VEKQAVGERTVVQPVVIMMTIDGAQRHRYVSVEDGDGKRQRKKNGARVVDDVFDGQ